jgi:DNA-binding NtrC family response regulator
MRFMIPPEAAPRVLVVDDEFEMAAMIADELGDRGYRALALRSGRDALVRLRYEAYDALVTDLRMPEIDGLQLLRLSRHLDPTRPVIVMTGHGAIDTAIEADRQGAYHYLTKPFSLSTLVHLLDQALGGRRKPEAEGGRHA